MSINNLAPFNATYVSGQIPSITPFTYRDGLTYLDRLTALGNYFQKVVLPYVEQNIQYLDSTVATSVEQLTDYVNESIDSILNASVQVQDSVIRANIELPTSQTRVALNRVIDTVIVNGINDVQSAIREALNSIYVEIGDIGNVSSSIRETLDALYVGKSDLHFFDESIVNSINNTNSTIRSALNAIFQIKDDVTAYGVKSDGVTDNTSALNALFSVKKDIYFPPGTYIIKDSLKVRSGMRIRGAGKYLTIIKSHPDMAPDKNLIQTSNLTGTAHSNYVTNIELSDFTVDGDAFNRPFTTALGENGSNIRLATVENATVRNVNSINPYQHCFDVTASIYFDDGNVNHNPAGMSRFVKFIDCDAYNTLVEDGFTTHNSTDILIQNCKAIHTQALYSGAISNGFEIDEGSARVVVDNCYASGWVAAYAAKGHTTTMPAFDVTFKNCVADNNETSFQVSSINPTDVPGGQTSVAKNVVIRDCVSLNTANKFGASNYAVRVLGYENVVVNNIIIRGGTMNHITFTDGADSIIVDGVYAENVYSAPFDTERAFIHIFGAAGQAKNSAVIKNVDIKTAIKNPAVRCSNANMTLLVDNLSAIGTGTANTWPVIFGNKAKGTAYRNIVSSGFKDNLPGWVDYDATPNTNFVLGNGTLTSKYQADGNKVDFRISLKFGSSTTLTGDLNFLLPIAAMSANNLVLTWYAIDASVSGVAGRAWGYGYATGSRVAVAMISQSLNVVNGTSPFTWAVNDIIEVIGSYERG